MRPTLLAAVLLAACSGHSSGGDGDGDGDGDDAGQPDAAVPLPDAGPPDAMVQAGVPPEIDG
ncbi:MAG TPA: hypothetical protein VL172_08455, partial [Kofleriaceae bacterium]|nr:hypothetical protein [Kofleriaceae bacterium]